jgi:hypothetical protein
MLVGSAIANKGAGFEPDRLATAFARVVTVLSFEPWNVTDPFTADTVLPRDSIP